MEICLNLETVTQLRGMGGVVLFFFSFFFALSGATHIKIATCFLTESKRKNENRQEKNWLDYEIFLPFLST